MITAAVHLLLDTSYCLYLIRTRDIHEQQAFVAYAPGEIAVSSLTVAALQGYAQTSSAPDQNRRALEQFLLPLVVADFDAESARLLAQTSVQAPLQGDIHAALLAAHARRLKATLVTRQPQQYAGIPGLRVQIGVAGATVAVPTLPPAMIPLPPRRQPAAGPHTIVMTGSHDLSLDLLADWLHAGKPSLVLAAAHVGSVAGLVALRQHEAHLAGVHLLDEETGEFNRAPVRHLLVEQGVHVVLVGFVNRVQGLLVARGNPKGIRGLADLARDDVVYVNRQPGAGTRVLLDHHVRRLQIDPAQIRGYARQATTHLAVASAVAQGQADCGLGIQAAAQAMGIDFVPLFDECFDLAIPAEHYNSPLLAPLLHILRQPDGGFSRQVAVLGGYDTRPMGKVLAEM